MSRGHVAGTLQTGVQPLQAFPTGQSLTGYAEHVYEQPEGEPPVETNAIRYWRDWAGLRNGQLELRLNNQRAPRVHGLGWGLDPDAGVWRPLRVDSTGALVVTGGGPTPVPGPPTAQLGAWYRADDILQAGGSTVVAWPDRSGNGATLLATGGASPTLATNVASLGGQNALNLDGSQQLARSTPPGYVGGNSAYSLYVVHDPVLDGTTTIPSVVFGWGGTGVANCRLTMFQYQFGGNWVCGMESYSAGSGGRLIPNGGQIYNPSLAHNALCAATVVTVNGVVLPDVDGAGGGPLAIPSPVPWVTLGHFPASTGPNGYKGKVAEILYYHKNHNASERAATLAYLSARYGIPV